VPKRLRVRLGLNSAQKKAHDPTQRIMMTSRVMRGLKRSYMIFVGGKNKKSKLNKAYIYIYIYIYIYVGGKIRNDFVIMRMHDVN
jgi:hypothetical protein